MSSKSKNMNPKAEGSGHFDERTQEEVPAVTISPTLCTVSIQNHII